jgi:hypothetical protein
VRFKLGRGGAKRTSAMSPSVAEFIPSTVVLQSLLALVVELLVTLGVLVALVAPAVFVALIVLVIFAALVILVAVLALLGRLVLLTRSNENTNSSISTGSISISTRISSGTSGTSAISTLDVTISNNIMRATLVVIIVFVDVVYMLVDDILQLLLTIDGYNLF